MKKIALFDVCHTLVNTSTIREFTEEYLRSPEHIFWKILRKLGFISDESYRLHYVKLFKGKSREKIESLGREYAHHLRTLLKPKTFTLLEQLRVDGYEIYLVSAGFDVYLKYFAERLKVQLVCTVLELDEQGNYTGKFSGIDCYGDGKVTKFKQVIQGQEIDWENSYSFGDSVTDIPILSLVGNTYVVDPEEELSVYARTQGWKRVEQ